MIWHQVRWQVSTGEYIFQPVGQGVPKQGIGLATFVCPNYSVALYQRVTVEYLSYNGTVIHTDLVRTDEERKAWNAQRDKYIEESDIRRLFRS